MAYMDANAVFANGIQHLTFDEIDLVDGAGLSWRNTDTNWADVGAWAVGGAVAGARGGLWGIDLGALGGGLGSYLSQHVQWK